MKNKLPSLMGSLTFVIASLGVQGCSSDRNAGGFGSETTNGVALRGTTMAGARVVARPVGALPGDTVLVQDSVGTDGRFEIRLPEGAWLVEWKGQGLGHAQNIRLSIGDTAFDMGDLPLAQLGRVAGIVGPGEKVALHGFAREATADSDGSFAIDSVPEGIWILGLSDGSEAIVNTASEPDTIKADRVGLLVEDFDDGDSRIALADLFGSGFWLVWQGESYGASIGDSLATDWDIAPLLSDSLAWTGTSMHAPITLLDTTGADLDAAVMLVLGGRGIGGEIESVHELPGDSVSFLAKGSGSVWFDVWAYRPNGDQVHLVDSILLDSSWTRHSLAWRDLQLRGTSEVVGASWDSLSVLKLTWRAREDADFWLDEVRLPGVTPLQFLQGR